ncbi:kinase-like protein [Xylaria arbuscula]|nr:kinase-like protein [Xylaria arbuscula]
MCLTLQIPGGKLQTHPSPSKDKTIRERPSVAKNYIVERKIFDRLGQHPRIVRCLGWVTEFPTGLLLAEASHGSLQCLIDTDNEAIPLSLRKSNLRPDNFLVHGNDLWLCDFGKSACEVLGISGGGIGSVLYTILRGHWPHRTQRGPFETLEEMDQYAVHAEDLFRQGIFPETKKYATVQDILNEKVLREC